MPDTLQAYKGLLGVETRPMNKGETTDLLTILGFQMEHPEGIDEIFEEATDDMGGRIAKGRLAAHGVQYDKALLLLILTFCESPGKIVMWCYTLHVMSLEIGRAATLDDFCKRFFPMGVPTDEAQHAAWDAQKGKECDNKLDACEWPTEKIEVPS